MLRNSNILKLKLLLIGSFITLSCLTAQTNKGDLLIRIKPVFNGSELKLNDQVYLNANGDSIYIDVFKFYLSNLCIKSSHNKLFCEAASYHLVDAEDSLTHSIIIKNIPTGNYSELQFAIGVDSIKNVSGALSGDLDPIKSMYWAWNTGYIAAKLEGHSNSCKTNHHSFEYHVGGYLPPFQSLRKNTVQLNELIISANKRTYLDIYADVSEWFKSPLNIKVSELTSIVIPNKQSVMMADNYADMIKFKSAFHSK